MNARALFSGIMAWGLLWAFASSANSPSSVFFANLKDGQKVSSKFTVKFGLEGMKLRPAGEDINDKTTGHHHLIVDAGPVAEGQVVPTDTQHLHFGKAQTETELTLPPGKHKLTLQLADGAHRSYGEKWSKTITVDVQK